MLFRLLARLDVKGPHLVKSINLEGVRVVGDPQEYAQKYDAMGIDEIVYLDTVASLYQRNSLADLVSRTTDHVFCPVTVAGGIRSVEDAKALLRAGADKVAINTAAVERPELISELADKFGAQAIVLQIDAKRIANVHGSQAGSVRWEARTDGGREPAPAAHPGNDVARWAALGASLGAGEILLTSIDQEGTRRGPDLALVSAVAKAVTIPVVASGGVGSPADVALAAACGASGVALAHVLHYGTASLSDIRKALSDAGVRVRTMEIT